MASPPQGSQTDVFEAYHYITIYILLNSMDTFEHMCLLHEYVWMIFGRAGPQTNILLNIPLC